MIMSGRWVELGKEAVTEHCDILQHQSADWMKALEIIARCLVAIQTKYLSVSIVTTTSTCSTTLKDTCVSFLH
jgi:hypothetical protein